LGTRRREKGEDDKDKKVGGKLVVFFLIFTLDFLPVQSMEFTLIYKGWKRDILFLMMPNLGP